MGNNKKHTAKIKLTEKQARNLAKLLDQAQTQAQTWTSHQEIQTLREKASEARMTAYNKKKKQQENIDCREDGHTWSKLTAYEKGHEKTHVAKGCKYCPAMKYRLLDSNKWVTEESQDKYLEEVGATLIGGKQSQ